MSVLAALLLGVVQGVFMFVPVSSTSHLVVVQTWLRDFGVDVPPPESPEMVLFDLVVHVGTLVSIVVVLHRPLTRLLSQVGEEWRRGGTKTRWFDQDDASGSRLVALGILTTVVTGVLGLMLRGPITEKVFASTTAVAVALVATGAMLWWTDAMTADRSGGFLHFEWRDRDTTTIWVAIAIGVAQAAALTPGLSRSGLTIFVALLCGMRRRLAARYSFFVAIPTILAASGFQALQVLGGDGLSQLTWVPFAVGFGAAAVVGAGALWLVLRLLEAARFRIFAAYVWLFAAVILLTGAS